MKKETNYIQEIIEDIKGLKAEYPNEPLCKHFGIATAEYGNIENVPSDKELAYLLNRYYQAKKLDMDNPIINFEFEENDFGLDDEEDDY